MKEEWREDGEEEKGERAKKMKNEKIIWIGGGEDGGKEEYGCEVEEEREDEQFLK